MSLERLLDESLSALASFGPDASGESICQVLDEMLRISEHSHAAKRLLMEMSRGGEIFLQLLSHGDAHVKYSILQLTRVLYHSNSIGTVASLLSNPDRMALIVDLLSPDSIPFVRNEALCLVDELSGDANPDLPSILAFQGIADSLLAILMEDPSLVDNATAFQALDILFRLCASEKSSRYIRESGGCDMVSELVSVLMEPVLDHAEGVGGTEDISLLEQRINNGWKQCEKALKIASELIRFMDSPGMKNVFVSTGLVGVLLVCGESLYLTNSARGLCYGFISQLVVDCWPVAEYLDQSGDFARIYGNLVEERTPLEVRCAIDTVVEALLGFEDLRDAQLGQFGDIGGSTDQAPGKIAYAIISHAACNVPMGIPDESGLASQLWFALRTVSHLGNSPDLQLALSRVRISDEKNLSQAIIGFSKKGNSPAVNCAALQVLTEWMVGNIGLVDKIVLEEIDLLKRVIGETKDVEKNNCNTSLDVNIIFLASVLLRASEVSEAVVGSVGAATMYRLLTEVEKRGGKRTDGKMYISLPIVHVYDLVESVFPPVKSLVLMRCLGQAAISDEVNIERVLTAQLEEARRELEKSQKEIIDFKRISAFGAVQLVYEKQHLEQLVTLLGEEVKIGESELQRNQLMREGEVSALKILVDEQQAQIQALVASYNQLNELSQTAEVADQNVQKELLELLREIRARFPETAALLDPAGIVFS